MFAILHALGMLVGDLFKSRARLEAEILLLRHTVEPCIAARTTTGSTARWRSRLHGLDDPALAEPAGGGSVSSAGDRAAMAASRFQSLLALEVEEEGGAAQD